MADCGSDRGLGERGRPQLDLLYRVNHPGRPDDSDRIQQIRPGRSRARPEGAAARHEAAALLDAMEASNLIKAARTEIEMWYRNFVA